MSTCHARRRIGHGHAMAMPIPLFSLRPAWSNFNFASFLSAFCINCSTKVGPEAECFHFELLELALAALPAYLAVCV